MDEELRNAYQLIAVLIHKLGGEVKISDNELIGMDNYELRRRDRADGTITLLAHQAKPEEKA